VPITFYCTDCTQKLRIDDDFAGKLVACTRCGSRQRVPLESQPERARRKERILADFETPLAGPVEPPPVPEAELPEAPEYQADPAPGPSAAAVAAVPRAKRKPEPAASLVRPPMSINFEDLIDMTAMVDIVFFLLIFFLVTSMKAIDSTVPMPAPDPQKGAAREPQALSDLEADNEYIVVHIDRNDRITVNDAEVHSERDLLFKLRELRTTGSRPEKLLVVGHGDATHGTAVMIMDTGRDVGIDSVRLAVADETE
jgi:biopolymer transport protein ExbD